MRIWAILFLVLFVVFFGAAELYPWLASLVGSPPGALAAGVLLAIASNLDKLPANVKPQKQQAIPPLPQASPSAAAPPQPKAAPPQTMPRVVNPPPQPQLPKRPISFTIKKPGS